MYVLYAQVENVSLVSLVVWLYDTDYSKLQLAVRMNNRCCSLHMP